MTVQFHDTTPLVDPGDAHWAGPLRSRQPRYVALTPPCNHACPAGEDIQGWLAHAQAGRFQAAWETLVADNPMPSVHGRVCYHPCETSCNRGELDSAVSIHAVERMLGDLAVEQGWTMPVAPPSGKRVLVVGAGPCGLSAAYHLCRRGHAVEVYDAGPLPGGMMHYGIPAYRLPRPELMAEIDRIAAMGVKFVPNRTVTDVAADCAAGGFDAVFLAIGTAIGRRIDIPGRDAGRVLTAVSLLHDAEIGQAPKLGRRVAIYGAGNTAMDAARTARRLGAEEATIVFFSDRAHMEANAFEAAEAEAEGVKIHWLTSIHALTDSGLTVEVMALDSTGTPQPTGRFETLAADSVVLALGQQADTGFLHNLTGVAFQPDGTVAVDAQMMTGAPGVFAGGDMVPGPRTVTLATGHGKIAARQIDAWLHGQTLTTPAPADLVSFAMLNLPVYSDADPSLQVEAAVTARLLGFGEILGGLTQEQAQHEAKRCLSCGNCFECDNCFAACPEIAIRQMGPGQGYAIDLALCTGCGVCVEQCPCHAMEMIPEPARAPTPQVAS